MDNGAQFDFWELNSLFPQLYCHSIYITGRYEGNGWRQCPITVSFSWRVFILVGGRGAHGFVRKPAS